MLTGTPFHSRTSALCQAQNWRRWAGHIVASSYELTHDWEYFAIRSRAALIDVSPLFKYLVRGPDARRFLNRVVTRDVEKCAEHQVLYTPWCNDDGKVIDDGTLSHLGPDTYRLTAAEPNLRWLLDNAPGFDVAIDDVTDTTAALAVQGPRSRDVLARVTGTSLDQLKFYYLTSAEIDGHPVTISRTGYTGDLGYEIWIDSEHAGALWDALVRAGSDYGLTPAGMLALDMARIEAGLLLIDVDYISAQKALIDLQFSSPFELGLGWAVRIDKGDFVGRRALEREKQTGSAWQFRGLEIQWDSLEQAYGEVGLPPQLPATAWRTSAPIYRGDAQVGYATSGCWSPILKKYIALAHLQSKHAAIGTRVTMEVTVEHQRRHAEAMVVQPRFFNPERKRSCP